MATDFDEEKQNKQLEDLHKLEEEQLVEILAASKYDIPYVDMSRLGVDNEAIRAIDEKDARELNVGPFKLSGKNIYIALLKPSVDLMSKLKEEMARKNLVPTFYMASHASLNKIWERYREVSMAEGSKAGGINISADILRNTAKNIQKMQDIGKYVEEAINGNGTHKISHILEIILAGAIAIKASDIHIESEVDRGRLRLRLDGVLQDVAFFSHEVYHLLNSRIKLLSGMKLTSVVAQDGRFSIEEGKDELSIRSSMIPGAYGESIVMRILDPKSIQVNLEDMGIEPFLFSVIQVSIQNPNGLILITGPTGSGKTTTLYAFLRKIYSPEIKIITIEDPIEYHLTGVTQTQTNEAKGYTF